MCVSISSDDGRAMERKRCGTRLCSWNQLRYVVLSIIQLLVLRENVLTTWSLVRQQLAGARVKGCKYKITTDLHVPLYSIYFLLPVILQTSHMSTKFTCKLYCHICVISRNKLINLICENFPKNVFRSVKFLDFALAPANCAFIVGIPIMHFSPGTLVPLIS
jgi:uncharacterized membrane protein YczE